MKLFPDKDPTTEASTYENSRRTGFKENWSNALGLSMLEDLPITSRFIPTTTESQRDQKLYDYRMSGDITPDVFGYFGTDTDKLARYARNVLGLEDIPSQEEYEKQKLEEYAGYREMSGKAFAQQSKMGFVGEMAGSAHAMALDPLYAVSFLTGYGSAATIWQASLRVGLMEAGIETAAQVSKIPWKQEIGADYGAAQTLSEIAFAGLGAGTITAIGKSLGKVVRPKDLTVGQALETFEKVAADNPELDPILNTLRHADPEDNLAKVMEADEAVDIRRATEGAKAQADPKGDLELQAPEIEVAEEAVFKKRAGIEEEGVPRGTPMGVGDRVNLLEQTRRETVITLKDAASRAQKKAISATKKYTKAEAAAKKAEKNPLAQEDSVAGRKAKQAAERARKLATDKEAAMTKAVEENETAKALSEEAVKTAKLDEGVPRGTPKPKPELPPDTRHPLVKAADDLVVDMDTKLKIMEDCF